MRIRRPALLALSLALVLAVPAACSKPGRSAQERSGAVKTPGSDPAVTAPSQGPGATAPAGAPGVSAADDWLTYHHDAGRTGVAGDQAPLGTVKKAWTSPALDGKVYGQPLVAGDAVIVVTEANSVYALNRGTGAVVWQKNLGAAVSGKSLPCGNIDPSGITGTPVVDAGAGTIDVVAFLADGAHHELFALDLAGGAVRWHRPIDPPGLSAKVEQERGAATIAGGRVYVPFGGLYGDCGPYKGAVVSSAADGSGDLAAWLVPTTREAGIWAPGGPAVDSGGHLWISTGNSESSSSFDYGNAVVHLDPALDAVDYFAPTNWKALNRDDADLGSASPVLLPGGRVFAIGKEGVGFLLDAAHLGHLGGQKFSAKVCQGGYGSAAVTGGLIYVPCVDGLVALRLGADRFDVAWRSPSVSTGAPIVAAGAVWAIDAKGTLTAFDPATGVPRFTNPLGPVTRFGSPAASKGLLVAATGQQVVGFSLR
ncbi:MAG TPA: PQQ-binding-like beta-propeller repeat protein [Acidimicrobiia bacterium]|nr:PQQ-binding-like beta-propeller repeat protein [Acidimicrobiia bacterium]